MVMPPQVNFSGKTQAKSGAAGSGVVRSSAGASAHHKNGDGGFWSAVTAFILLMIFFFFRTGVGKNIATMSLHTKEILLGAALLLDIYAFSRKISQTHHDLSYRQYVTNFIIWITLIFVVPGLIFYLFLT